MRLKTSKFAVIFFSGITLLSSTFAYAELGGDFSTVQKDSKKLGSPITTTTQTTTAHSQYNRHEMSKGRMHVREYADSNGKVFGIAWNGSKHPDLRTLMGSHFNDFQAAMVQGRRNHHHGGTTTVDSGNIHLEMGGRMMSVYGRVWLTDQVPTGMNLHEIQ